MYFLKLGHYQKSGCNKRARTSHPSGRASRITACSCGPISKSVFCSASHRERIVMLRRVSAVSLTCALLLTMLLCAPALRAQQVAMPRLNYKERTLTNGLRVISAVDKSSPTVAIDVWYHVGSKDDPEGRSGFAHLF